MSSEEKPKGLYQHMTLEGTTHGPEESSTDSSSSSWKLEGHPTKITLDIGIDSQNLTQISPRLYKTVSDLMRILHNAGFDNDVLLELAEIAQEYQFEQTTDFHLVIGTLLQKQKTLSRVRYQDIEHALPNKDTQVIRKICCRRRLGTNRKIIGDEHGGWRVEKWAIT